jgi:hypothetical protein
MCTLSYARVRCGFMCGPNDKESKGKQWVALVENAH